MATCPGSTWSDLLVIPIVAAITSGFVVQAIGQEAACRSCQLVCCWRVSLIGGLDSSLECGTGTWDWAS